jgi:hypothetical protein
MNALISGQAGVAVLLEAGPSSPADAAASTEPKPFPLESKPLYAVSSNAPDEKWHCATWMDARNLLAGADDFTEHRHVTHEKAVKLLDLAWAQDRALQLTLALLDPKLKRETRAAAARGVGNLFTDSGSRPARVVEQFVANRLYSIPLPKEGVDLTGAIEVARQADETMSLAHFLYGLDNAQLYIRDVRTAWDQLPLALFGADAHGGTPVPGLEEKARSEQEKARCERVLISSGGFRQVTWGSRTSELAALGVPGAVIVAWGEEIDRIRKRRSTEKSRQEAEWARQRAEETIERTRRSGASELVLKSYYGLKEVPESLGQLTQLQDLDLSGNQLTALPESLGQLTQLRQLNLRDNRLAVVSPLEQLTQLRTLNLYGNCLTALPAGLRQLTQLQELTLWRNQLAELPEWIGELAHLQRLDLMENRLTDLPSTLGQLTELRSLDLSANPLNPELEAAYQEGLGAVMAYLRAKSGEPQNESL